MMKVLNIKIINIKFNLQSTLNLIYKMDKMKLRLFRTLIKKENQLNLGNI